MKLTALFLLLFLCVQHVYAGDVHIVLSKDSKTYTEAGHKLASRITPFISGDSVNTITLDELELQKFDQSDLIITVGNEAASALSRANISIPVIQSYASSNVISQLNNQWPATVISQPISRLIKVIDPLHEGYKNRLIVAVSKGNTAVRAQLSKMPKTKNSELDVILLNDTDKPAKSIEDKLFNAGGLIAVSDDQIWQGENARWMLYQSYRYKVPVVGYSKKFLKAGALVSVYSTIDQIADSTAKLVEDWKNTGKVSAKGIIYSNYNIEYNQNIARALNISIPDNRFEVETEK